MAKRQTIGDHPLDYMMEPEERIRKPVELIEEASTVIGQKKKNSVLKQRITVQISEDVIERVKNSVYWTPGLTLASLAEEALSKAVDALEQERGTPFEKRKEELKTGRPIK